MKTYLYGEHTTFLFRYEFAFNAVIRFMKVEISKLNICISLHEIHTSIVTEKLRLPQGVGDYLRTQTIERDKCFSQGLLQNTKHAAAAAAVGAGRFLVAEENAEVQRRQQQV